MLVCLEASLLPLMEAAGGLSTAEARLGIFRTLTSSLARFSRMWFVSLSRALSYESKKSPWGVPDY